MYAQNLALTLSLPSLLPFLPTPSISHTYPEPQTLPTHFLTSSFLTLEPSLCRFPFYLLAELWNLADLW